MLPPPHISTLFPYTTLFRSSVVIVDRGHWKDGHSVCYDSGQAVQVLPWCQPVAKSTCYVREPRPVDFWYLLDRKSTRLNSSHTVISYAVFCLKKKKKNKTKS